MANNSTHLIFNEEELYPRCPLRCHFKVVKAGGTIRQNILCCLFSFSFHRGCDLNLTCGNPPPSHSAAYFKQNILPHASGHDKNILGT